MSNVIPIVSSSPPPLDDDAGFKWDIDDDDDDYGNFASAPSISATTVTSDTSFEANWSTSETSVSVSDGVSKASPIRSDSEINGDGLNISNIDSITSGNIQSGNENCRDSAETRILGNDYEVIENNEDSDNFEHFDAADSLETVPPRVSHEETENKSSPHQDSLLSQTENGSESCVVDDEDEFQDFAQFNSTVPTEDSHKSAAHKQELNELSPENNKTHSSQNILTLPVHSNQEVHSSSHDTCSETVVTDSESAGSVHLKNSDSIYSSASTADSGVFSADMSPSCHPGETSDVSPVNEKVDTPTQENAVVHQTDIHISSSLYACMSSSDDKTREVGEEPDKNITSVDNSLVSDSDNLVSKNLSISVDTPEVVTNIKEVQYCVENFSDKGDSDAYEDMCSDADEDMCTKDHKHLNPTQRKEVTDNSSSFTDFSASANVLDEAAINQSELPALGCSVPEDSAVDSVEANEDELKETDYDRDNSSIVVNEDIVECDTVGSKQSEAGDSSNTDLESSDDNVSSDHQDLDNFVEEVEEVKEFGNFTFSTGQSDNDDDVAHEIAPITFRTSICETAESEVEDGDEFSFDIHRPPIIDDDAGSNSREIGEASKDISDSDGSDDFGDFDSAQNPPLKNSSHILNNNSESFGDFDKPEPAAEDDDGWADFGAAPTPVSSSSDSSVPKTQVTVPANPEQSKSQKLRNAVINSFSESPVATTSESQQTDEIKDNGHSQENNHGVNSLYDDESPLPLDVVVDLGLSNALEAKQQTWTVVQHPAKKEAKVKLWSHLKDVDSCHALMYTWHASHCSKEVFATLHIDTQNILFTHKKQAVPFFAPGLGILEPIRGGGTVLDRKKEKSIITMTHPTLLESSKIEYQQNPTTQDIPPVDFDWSSSGLTNPLTANTLDLDFLVIQGSDSCEKTSVFKADSQESVPAALHPLEEILKKSTPTVRPATNEILSPETVHILKKMPNLSFMQSRVLMFPVKQ